MTNNKPESTKYVIFYSQRAGAIEYKLEAFDIIKSAGDLANLPAVEDFAFQHKEHFENMCDCELAQYLYQYLTTSEQDDDAKFEDLSEARQKEVLSAIYVESYKDDAEQLESFLKGEIQCVSFIRDSLYLCLEVISLQEIKQVVQDLPLTKDHNCRVLIEEQEEEEEEEEETEQN